MATARDVAKFIAESFCFDSKLTSMKLQKLVYYSQAWHLVWHEEPLFDDKIFAWANGPIVPDLYTELRDAFDVSLSSWDWGGPAHSDLTKDQQESVLAVLRYYGAMTGQDLSDLTHQEDPWRDARRGMPATERGESEITIAAMDRYYGGLAPDGGYDQAPEL